jgi:hypothetical protein
VQVLDDERGGLAQLVEHRREQVLARTRDRLGERAARLVGDVAQRPHRPRRDQRVAGAPQHAVPVGERGHQRRLSDPGLAGHDDHAPRRPHSSIAVSSASRSRSRSSNSKRRISAT